MKFSFTKLQKMILLKKLCKICVLKSTEFSQWKLKKSKINWEINCVNGLKGSISLSCYSPQNWTAATLSNACMISRFSCVRFFVTLWTVVHQTPLSMGFSQQEYLSGFPFPPPGDLPDPGIEPTPLYVSCIGRWALYH